MQEYFDLSIRKDKPQVANTLMSDMLYVIKKNKNLFVVGRISFKKRIRVEI